MKYLVLVMTLALAGCGAQGATFFGTADPCAQGEALHAGFITIGGHKQSTLRAEKAAITAFRAQCSDGSVEKVTLAKSLRVYSEALAVYKAQ